MNSTRPPPPRGNASLVERLFEAPLFLSVLATAALVVALLGSTYQEYQPRPHPGARPGRPAPVTTR